MDLKKEELSVAELLKYCILELNEDQFTSFCKNNEKDLISTLEQALSKEFALQKRNNVSYYQREDWLALKKKIIQIIDEKRPHYRFCCNQQCPKAGKCLFTSEQACECWSLYNTFCQRCQKFQEDDFEQHRAVCINTIRNMPHKHKPGFIYTFEFQQNHNLKMHILSKTQSISDLELSFKWHIETIHCDRWSLKRDTPLGEIFQNGDLWELHKYSPLSNMIYGFFKSIKMI